MPAEKIQCKDSKHSESDRSKQVVHSLDKNCVLCKRSQKDLGKSHLSSLSCSFPHHQCL